MESLLILLVHLGLISAGPVLSPVQTNTSMVSVYEIPPLITKPSMLFGAIQPPTPTSIPQVLGSSINISNSISTPASTSAIASDATSSSNVIKATRQAKKPNISIAILGDSMVDTLGLDFPLLTQKLKEIYPASAFTIFNHGVGGKNINDGLSRLVKPYVYNDENRPSLISQKPDVVILESFSYNPYTFDDGALDTHWLALAYLVDTVKQNLPESKIVIFSTIAPNTETFGDGVPLFSLDAAQKLSKTATIKRYLENSIKFSQSQNLPLADAYHRSLDESGNGKLIYINSSDHIHYSDKGKDLVASVITETIVSNKLIE